MIFATLAEFRKGAILLVYVGNFLTLVGCFALVGGTLGVIPLEAFALGLSSGLRIIAMVAITGCLLSAIGYGIQDYFHP